jgi:hypothetical protein
MLVHLDMDLARIIYLLTDIVPVAVFPGRLRQLGNLT